MGSLSPLHWLLVIVAVLLLFGPSRLATLGKGLGEGIREFKRGVGGEHTADRDARQLPEKRA